MAAVSPSRVAGAANILAGHAFGEVAKSKGALPLI